MLCRCLSQSVNLSVNQSGSLSGSPSFTELYNNNNVLIEQKSSTTIGEPVEQQLLREPQLPPRSTPPSSSSSPPSASVSTFALPVLHWQLPCCLPQQFCGCFNSFVPAWLTVTFPSKLAEKGAFNVLSTCHVHCLPTFCSFVPASSTAPAIID